MNRIGRDARALVAIACAVPGSTRRGRRSSGPGGAFSTPPRKDHRANDGEPVERHEDEQQAALHIGMCDEAEP